MSLPELARACAERAARGGADIRCELSEIPLMMLRPLAMQRLVDNLIANAARHAGGEILVRTACGEDRATLSVLANLGMSTQLLVFGVCLALGRPALFAWVVLSELALVLLLALRRERVVAHVAEESA